MLLPTARKGTQHLQRLSRRGGARAKLLIVMGLLVDLIGIEPMTSSMPWNCRKRKLLTAKWLEVGETGKTGKIAPL